MSFYRLNVYKINENMENKYKEEFLDSMIVKSKFGTVTEPISKTPLIVLSKRFYLINADCDKKGYIRDIYIDHSQMSKKGYQLVVFKEDLNERNKVATKYSINKYMEEYENSEFNKLLLEEKRKKDQTRIDKITQKIKSKRYRYENFS